MVAHLKHIGLAGIVADEGKLDYEAVVKHFMKVNKVTRKEFDGHHSAAFEQWEMRSERKWKTDLGKFASLVETQKPKRQTSVAS